MTVRGELKISASQELGGLGATQGPAVSYAYSVPSLLPQALPYLLILLLLLDRPNRSWRAWWIWPALASVFGVEYGMQAWLTMVPSEPRELLCQMVNGLGFGIAAVWLTSSYLVRQKRFLTFLCVLMVMALAGACSYLIRLEWQEDTQLPPVLVYLGIISGVLSMALSLAGFACRRHYSVWRFLVNLYGWLLVGFSVAAAPFIISSWVTMGSARWMELIVSVLIASGITFAIVLPFLILSFVNSLFSERMEKLWHLGSAPPAAVEARPSLPVLE